jgi:hypothetical protein
MTTWCLVAALPERNAPSLHTSKLNLNLDLTTLFFVLPHPVPEGYVVHRHCTQGA